MTYVPPENVTTNTEMFTWINGVVDNFFFPSVLFAVFFIILIKNLTNPSNTFSKSLASASFICMILSIIARTLDFISTGFMSIFIVLTAVSAILMHMENN